MEPWAWGVLVPVALALVGSLWKLFGRQTEKGESQNAKDIERVEKRLDDHITEDVKVHERVVKIETQMETANREISDLRIKTTGMKHDILNEVMQKIMNWYNDVIERLLRK